MLKPQYHTVDPIVTRDGDLTGTGRMYCCVTNEMTRGVCVCVNGRWSHHKIHNTVLLLVGYCVRYHDEVVFLTQAH